MNLDYIFIQEIEIQLTEQTVSGSYKPLINKEKTPKEEQL